MKSSAKKFSFHWHFQLGLSSTCLGKATSSSSSSVVSVQLLNAKLLLLLLLLTTFVEQMLLFSTTPFLPEVAIKTFWHLFVVGMLEIWPPFGIYLLEADVRWWSPSHLVWFSLKTFPTRLTTRLNLDVGEEDTIDIGWWLHKLVLKMYFDGFCCTLYIITNPSPNKSPTDNKMSMVRDKTEICCIVLSSFWSTENLISWVFFSSPSSNRWLLPIRI